MTTAERDIITVDGTTDGLLIFNTDNGYFEYYRDASTGWATLRPGNEFVEGTGRNGQVSFWTGSGNTSTITGDYGLYYDVSNTFLGINNLSPSFTLDVDGDINATGHLNSNSISVVNLTASETLTANTGVFENLVANVDFNASTFSSTYLSSEFASFTNIEVAEDITTNNLTSNSISSNTVSTEHLRLEDSETELEDSETDFYINFESPDNLTENYSLTFPLDNGSVGGYLTTDGDGQLTWVSPNDQQDFVVDNSAVNPATQIAVFDGSNTISGSSMSYTSAGDLVMPGGITSNSISAVTGSFTNLDIENSVTLSEVTIKNADGGVTNLYADGTGSTSYYLPTAGGSAGQFLQTNGSGTLNWADPVVENNSITFSNAENGGIAYNNSGTLTSFDGLIIDNSNTYLGIGTASPSYSLDVDGFIRTGDEDTRGGLIIGNGQNTADSWLLSSTLSTAPAPTFTLPENTGNPGAYLTTDGSGNLSWTAKEPVYFDAYDNTGGQVFGASAITVLFDTKRENANATNFELTSGIVTVNVTDKFFVSYRVGVDISTGTARSENITYLEKNSGGGWIEVDGFRTHEYNRTQGVAFSTASAMGIVDIASGDQLRIRAVRGSGTDNLVTIADGSSISLFAIKNSGSGPAGPPGPEGPESPAGSSSDFINLFNSGTGGVTINSTAGTIPYNSISNSSGSIFNLGSDNHLEINASDDFLIQYTVSLEQTGSNNRTQWQTWLERDNGAGFIEIDGIRGTGYSREILNGENTSFGQTIVTVSGSATFRVRAEDTSTNRDHEPINNGCSMVVYTLRGGEQGPAGPEEPAGGSGTFVSGNGNIGEIAFWKETTASETITGNSNLKFNETNNWLGVGVSSPSYNLDVASDVNIGNDGSSGTLSLFSENGGTDHLIRASSEITKSLKCR